MNERGNELKLQEAIKIMESELPNAMPNNPPRRLDALKLLIEAGKREQANRDNPAFVIVGALPGEPEEADHAP